MTDFIAGPGMSKPPSKRAEEKKRALIEGMLKNEHFLDVVLQCWEIYDKKGKDYTRGLGDKDRLDNFTQSAERTGVTFLQAWGVLFYKHVAATWKFVKDGRVESEPIEGRLYDVINYTILLLLHVKELRYDEELEDGADNP